MSSRFLLIALAGLVLGSVGTPSVSLRGQTDNGPRFELRPGSNYFQVDGKPAFVLGRNPVAIKPEAFEEHFRHAAAFVRGVDYTGFAPVPRELSGRLKGAVLGNDKRRLGWFRDAKCEPPEWPTNPVSGLTVTLDAPGDSWQAEFFDPATGKSAGEGRLRTQAGRLRITLPEFQGSVAVG
jgi:hypothetical protein